MTPTKIGDMKNSAINRVWTKVAYEHGCWVFKGGRDRNGYGRVSIPGMSRLAHRAVYIALVGDPGPSLVLDHLCRNPSCVNPDHMEPVSMRTNVDRGSSTHPSDRCKEGHLLYGDNLRMVKNGKGRKRVCLTCNAVWQARYKAKRMARVVS